MSTASLLRARWALLAGLCSATACFSKDDGGGTSGPGSSSGSHWLACDEDGDCSAHGTGAMCGDEGVCVNASGEPIEVTGGTGGAGNTATGTGGTGGAGATGGSAGTAAGTAGGGMGGGGEPCGSTTCRVGSRCCNPCTGSCVDEGADIECIGDACMSTGGAGGSGGSGGGYEPCAGKNCGETCTLCAPDDAGCVETNDLKVCSGPNGTCFAGAIDCSPPAECDLAGPNTCGELEVCCDSGRCGPVSSGEGRCEAADPTTGVCKPCACASQPGGCPKCNAPDTRIATPAGDRAIADLREGDLVLSMHRGALVAVPILRTRQMTVHDHAVVRLTFADGRQAEISGTHPTADGRRLDALVPGDALGEARVVAVETVPYAHDRTYDILPASDTGTYLAAGALIGSTLSPGRAE